MLMEMVSKFMSVVQASIGNDDLRLNKISLRDRNKIRINI